MAVSSEFDAGSTPFPRWAITARQAVDCAGERRHAGFRIQSWAGSVMTAPTTEENERVFARVNEPHDAIGRELLAPSAGRGAPPTVSRDTEYKALRDEIVHLFNRVYVTLAAIVGGSIVVAHRALELSRPPAQPSPPEDGFTAALVLVLGGLLAATAGAVLTYKIFDHIFKLRSYLLVYHEDGRLWHRRASAITEFIAKQPGVSRRFYGRYVSTRTRRLG